MCSSEEPLGGGWQRDERDDEVPLEVPSPLPALPFVERTCSVFLQWEAVSVRNGQVDLAALRLELIVKQLKDPFLDRKKTKNINHSGNLTKAQLFDIVRLMRPKRLAKVDAKHYSGKRVAYVC